jgi:hypothetical protein
MELKKEIPSNHESSITIDLPKEWEGVPLEVTILPVEKNISDAEEIIKCLIKIRETNTTFKKIKDPVKWQREQRKSWDRKLF